MRFTTSVLNMYVRSVKIKWGDLLIVLLILFTAISVWLCFLSDSSIVEVRQNNELLYKVDLNDPSNDGREFVIEGDYRNVLCVEDQKLYVIESNCPDQICKYSHPIDRDGGVLCCVPNGVVISVAQDNGLDVMIR